MTIFAHTLPTDMTEEMLNAAHQAAHESRHLPWREAEQARWQAILSVAPKQDDAARLVWAMRHMATGNHYEKFTAHVLRVGGAGDVNDCRAFIDAASSAARSWRKTNNHPDSLR